MHHVRGLVRPSSAGVLRKLEERAVPHDVSTCFLSACFIDGLGTAVKLQLLHAAALLRVVAGLSNAEALQRVREAKKLSTTSLSQPLLAFDRVVSDDEGPCETLYVKRSSDVAVMELGSRQSRFLSKVEGRLIAHDLGLVEAFTEELLRKGGHYSEDDVSRYRGVVEELVKFHPDAALALGINTKLPSLGSGAATALARLVPLEKPASVLSFLEGFAAKDELLPASETCATQLAVRLRNRLWSLGNSPITAVCDNPQASEDCTPVSPERLKKIMQESIVVACRFNVDPSVVFPTDAEAIQRWSCQFLDNNMRPLERAERITDVIRCKRLVPRRVALDCLSNWCLFDLERPWFSALLGADVAAEARKKQGTGSTDVDEAVVYHSALSCALKDPKRNLVDNRLLFQYAQLLNEGEIDPHHSSFPYFIEECGECHSDMERPEEFSFLLKSSHRSVIEELLALAPHCSYWRTLLERKSECVEVTVAPRGHVRVTVKLPCEHECVKAAKAAQDGDPSSPSFSTIPILYEDDDILIISKPPNVATSRHALSCTQLRDDKVTDVVSLQLADKKRGDAVGRVFRQGQVHRLDAETSGCLIMAKSDIASSSLRHQVGTSAAYSECNKVYLALCVVVESQLANIPLSGVLRDPIDAKNNNQISHCKVFQTLPYGTCGGQNTARKKASDTSAFGGLRTSHTSGCRAWRGVLLFSSLTAYWLARLVCYSDPSTHRRSPNMCGTTTRRHARCYLSP